MQEDLINNLKFLRKILDSVPNDVVKIEDVIFNVDLEIPQSLDPTGDSSIQGIIAGINTRSKLEIEYLKQLYGHFPKNLISIMNDRVLETLIMNSEIPSKGEISRINSVVELHLESLNLINTFVSTYVSFSRIK
jgi:hypothetical protein